MKPTTTLKPYNNNNKINKTTSATTTTLSKTREKQKHLSKQIKERSSSFFLFAFCTHSYHVTFIIFTEIQFFIVFVVFVVVVVVVSLIAVVVVDDDDQIVCLALFAIGQLRPQGEKGNCQLLVCLLFVKPTANQFEILVLS